MCERIHQPHHQCLSEVPRSSLAESSSQPLSLLFRVSLIRLVSHVCVSLMSFCFANWPAAHSALMLLGGSPAVTHYSRSHLIAMSTPNSADSSRRGSLRAVPYSQLPARSTQPPRKGKAKGQGNPGQIFSALSRHLSPSDCSFCGTGWTTCKHYPSTYSKAATLQREGSD